MEENNISNESFPRKRRHKKQISTTTIFKIRTILNIIFIIGSIVGMVIYFFHSEIIGGIIILSSMIFKFVESLFRLLYK